MLLEGFAALLQWLPHRVRPPERSGVGVCWGSPGFGGGNRGMPARIRANSWHTPHENSGLNRARGTASPPCMYRRACYMSRVVPARSSPGGLVAPLHRGGSQSPPGDTLGLGPRYLTGPPGEHIVCLHTYSNRPCIFKNF